MLFVLFSFSLSWTPTDPLFNKQFPLKNTGQFNGISGNDIRIFNFWNTLKLGENVPVAVISDGCFYEHEDLKDNFDLNHSWNYYSWENDPKHNQTYRGTQLASIISSKSNNICTVGVAPNSTFSCLNIDNENKTRSNILDALSRDNRYFRVKLLGTVEKCKNVCRHEEFDEELHDILMRADPGVNFVAPAGADAFRGGDTNFFPLNRDPRVIVVSDLTHRNAHSSWSNRGTSILVNAPVGGSSSFDSIMYPSSPSLSHTDKKGCTDDTDPVGAGAAYVAGVVALMVQTNPSLTWRDIQYMLAITSSKNNPNHHSWVTNKAGYHYSHFYGFGTIAADWLHQMCKEWKKIPDQVNSQGYVETNENVPTMHKGSLDIKIDVNSKIIFIEYVQIQVNIDVKDASLLRMKLTSPSGTTMFFKATSISDDSPHSIVLTYTIRGFLGESAAGSWMLHIVSDSIGSESLLKNVKLDVFGMTSTPSTVKVPTRSGENPYQELSKERKATIVLDETETLCLTNLTVNVSSNATNKANIYMATPDKAQRWPVIDQISIPSDTQATSVDLHLPCFFTDKSKMKLVLEDMESGVWTDADITIQNTKLDLILLKPERYQVIKSTVPTEGDRDQAIVDFEIVPAMQMPYWLDGSYAQRARVSLLDMETNNVIFRADADMKNEIIIHYNGTHCPKCLLGVVPSWHHDMNDCLTMLQPISILSYWDTEPEKWILPLNDYCPIPPGVMTPTPTPLPTPSPNPSASLTPLPTITPDKHQNKPAIYTGGAFVGFFAIFLGVFMFVSKRKKVALHDKSLLHEDNDFA